MSIILYVNFAMQPLRWSLEISPLGKATAVQTSARLLEADPRFRAAVALKLISSFLSPKEFLS